MKEQYFSRISRIRYSFANSKANAPQEYETIDESELRDDDVVVEHIHEEAKTEEK